MESPENLFLSAVERLADGALDAMGVFNTADMLQQSGRLDLAARLYRLGIRCGQPAGVLHAFHYNLGVVLDAMGDVPAARAAYEQALAAAPDFQPARLNLGVALARRGDIDAALAQWSGSIEQLGNVNALNIRYKKLALSYRAYHLEQARRYAEAEAALTESLSIDPHQEDLAQQWLALRQEQCTWPLMVPFEGWSRERLQRVMLPLSLAAYSDDALLQLASAWRYHRKAVPAPVAPRPRHARPKGQERLRIGYLSSDLRAHAVGYLIPEVFERHDRTGFEVVAYYTNHLDPDALSRRLMAASDQWVDIARLNDDAAAERIAADGIDILIDLNGNTRDARTGIFARRPAPVAVNWLGYPATMGSPDHHYIIADDWIIPEGHEIYFSETVLRLPCYQPNDTKRQVAAPPAGRGEAGLPEDAVVYCCFNATHKITRFTFERWMAILHQVPHAVLWLLDISETARSRLAAAAERAGIAATRVVFAPRLPNPQHLARYPLADLFLDTAPYGAHTTGSDSLWMGVPVLTLSGRSFASRVCGSLVRAAGLPELVCATPDEYVARAVELGHDRDTLRQLKERLVSGRSSCMLFDMERLVRALEDLYRTMANAFRNGRLPVPDLTNLDAYLGVGSEQDFDTLDSMAMPDYEERYRRGLARLDARNALPADRRLWRKP